MANPTGPAASGADFASLFDRGPEQWGLRGDPHLWRAMHDELVGVPMPTAFWDVRSTVEREFERITGHRLVDTSEPLRVAAFVTGSGMSDGHVLPTFWVRTAIPILIDRCAAHNAAAASAAHDASVARDAER